MRLGPIRVLHVVTQLNCNGLENRIMDIYNQIDRNIIQFDFYTFSKEEGYFDNKVVSLGGKIFYNNPISPIHLNNITNKIYTFLLDHPEYTIVHCHLNQWSGYILKGALKADTKIRIAHSRNAYKVHSLKDIMRIFFRMNVNKYASHRFAVSDKAALFLFGKKIFKSGKVNVYPNAIDVKKYHLDQIARMHYRNELKLGDSYTIIHVGRFSQQKNHRFLVNIFSEIYKIDNNVNLLLVGEGEYIDNIKSYANELDCVNHIHFLGMRSDIPQLLQAADVFVFPSLYEGFPGAVLEAEAAGLPCVISDTITDEVCIIDCVKKCRLDLPISQWIENILYFRSYKRKDCTKKLIDSGYDIEDLTLKMTDFYVKNS